MPTQCHRLEFRVELGFGLKVEAFLYDDHIWPSKESQDYLEELESRKNKFDVLCLREFPSYKVGSKVVHFEHLSQNLYMEISILYKIFNFFLLNNIFRFQITYLKRFLAGEIFIIFKAWIRIRISRTYCSVYCHF